MTNPLAWLAHLFGCPVEAGRIVEEYQSLLGVHFEIFSIVKCKGCGRTQKGKGL